MRLPWLTLAVAGAAVATQLAPGAAEALELSRAGLARGELWRLATGHLAHWSAEHAAWDVLTFAGLGVLCEARSRRETAATLALAIPAVALAAFAAVPGLASYRGLSALDVALFALLALQVGGRLGAALGALVAGKLAWELATGAALFVAETGAAVALVPVAHVAGAAAAVAAFGACRLSSASQPGGSLRGALALEKELGRW